MYRKMAELLLVCPRCNAEHKLSESKGGRCLRCAVLLACEQYRATYLRLARKLDRYRQQKLPHRALEVQMTRHQERIARTIMEFTLDEKGEELLGFVLADFEAPMRRIIRV